MKIDSVEIARDKPCRFIAEISNNHNGDQDRALRMVKIALDAGADFVKFQAYTPDELVALRGDGPAPEPWGSQGWTMRALYEKARTPLEWFPALFERARELGIVPFASVFGAESLAALEAVNCPAYKIARLDNGSAPLITSAAATGKPLVVSRAMTDRPFAIAGAATPLWLYCPPGYPQEVADIKLPLFDEPEVNEGPPLIGMSVHTKHPKLPSAAVARGAKLLEYHLQLRDEPSDLEAEVSVDEHQFSAIVRGVRLTEELLNV